ncbi:MAG: hypothetical protein ACON4K_10805 [Akkermansiaceae bacterium]
MRLFLRFTSPPATSILLAVVRVPWIIVVFSILLTLLVTWKVRTKDMDFMTPANTSLPPEDFGEDLATGAPVMQPKIVDGPKIDLPAPPTETEEPVVTEISEQDLGDLQSSPGLGEYRSFARKHEPVRLLELSSTLQARGNFQRALIALERIIDTSQNVSPEDLKQATSGISTLSPTLPQWNVDPKTEVELTLLISSSGGASAAIKEAALEVATLIRKHSGDQLQITPKILKTPKASNPEKSPLTIAFQREDLENPASTAVLTLRAGGESEAEEFVKAVFRLVRGHLAGIGYTFPENFDAPARDLLSFQVTRLMWRDFASSLAPHPEEASDREEN